MKPHHAQASPPLELRGHVLKVLQKTRTRTTYSFCRSPDGPDQPTTIIYLVIHAPTCTLDPDDHVRLTVHSDDPNDPECRTYHHFPSDTRITNRTRRSPRP